MMCKREESLCRYEKRQTVGLTQQVLLQKDNEADGTRFIEMLKKWCTI
jgi:hypothetical protein